MSTKSRHRKGFILRKKGTRKIRGGVVTDGDFNTNTTMAFESAQARANGADNQWCKVEILNRISGSNAYINRLVYLSTKDLVSSMIREIRTPPFTSLLKDAPANLTTLATATAATAKGAEGVALSLQSFIDKFDRESANSDTQVSVINKREYNGLMGRIKLVYDFFLTMQSSPKRLTGNNTSNEQNWGNIHTAIKAAEAGFAKSDEKTIKDIIGPIKMSDDTKRKEALTLPTIGGNITKNKIDDIKKMVECQVYPFELKNMGIRTIIGFFDDITINLFRLHLRLVQSLDKFIISEFTLLKHIAGLGDEPAVLNQGAVKKSRPAPRVRGDGGKGGKGAAGGKGSGGKGGKGNAAGRGNGLADAGSDDSEDDSEVDSDDDSRRSASRLGTEPVAGYAKKDAAQSKVKPKSLLLGKPLGKPLGEPLNVITSDNNLLKAIKTAGDKYERSRAFYALLEVLNVPKITEQSIMRSIRPFDGNVTPLLLTNLDAQIGIFMMHVSANKPTCITALKQAASNTNPDIQRALSVYNDSGKDFENTFIALLSNIARSYIISSRYETEIRANAREAFFRSVKTNTNNSKAVIDKLTIKDEDTEDDITAKKNALIVFSASGNDIDITREALGKAIFRQATRRVPPKAPKAKRPQVQAQIDSEVEQDTY